MRVSRIQHRTSIHKIGETRTILSRPKHLKVKNKNEYYIDTIVLEYPTRAFEYLIFLVE